MIQAHKFFNLISDLSKKYNNTNTYFWRSHPCFAVICMQSEIKKKQAYTKKSMISSLKVFTLNQNSSKEQSHVDADGMKVDDAGGMKVEDAMAV